MAQLTDETTPASRASHRPAPAAKRRRWLGRGWKRTGAKQ
jgi:hypothetical protein